MKNISQQRHDDQRAIYCIEVRGHLDPQRADWFEGMIISTWQNTAGESVATLEGPLPDQAALHGIMNSLHTLGLTLLTVQRIEKGEIK